MSSKTTPQSNQAPPANLEAEAAVLGAMLVDPECTPEVAALLRPTHFYREAHGWIYNAILELYGGESAVDAVTLSASLQDHGQLDACGGYSYIGELVSLDTHPVHAAHYANLVYLEAQRRAQIRTAQDLVKYAYDRDISPVDGCERTIATLERITTPDAQKAVMEWEQTFDAFMTGQMYRLEHKTDKKPTMPWASLSFVRPPRPGMLCTIAAASGMGKTTVLEMCAEWWARLGFQIVFFHYELSHQIMLDRRMCRWSGDSMATIEDGDITPRMMQADELMRAWEGRIHYVFCDSWSMARLAAKAKNMARQGKANIVIVDYLQKAPLKEHVRGMTTAQMRGADAETLKSMAEREKVPVMAGSQVNRAGAKAATVTRAGIRDSGEIDEKSNLVLTMDREILKAQKFFGGRIYEKGSYSPEVVMRVDKQTLGGTGERKLLMNPARFTIADIDQGPEDGEREE
jgi:replicative DNA helicase